MHCQLTSRTIRKRICIKEQVEKEGDLKDHLISRSSSEGKESLILKTPVLKDKIHLSNYDYCSQSIPSTTKNTRRAVSEEHCRQKSNIYKIQKILLLTGDTYTCSGTSDLEVNVIKRRPFSFSNRKRKGFNTERSQHLLITPNSSYMNSNTVDTNKGLLHSYSQFYERRLVTEKLLHSVRHKKPSLMSTNCISHQQEKEKHLLRNKSLTKANNSSNEIGGASDNDSELNTININLSSVFKDLSQKITPLPLKTSIVRKKSQLADTSTGSNQIFFMNTTDNTGHSFPLFQDSIIGFSGTDPDLLKQERDHDTTTTKKDITHGLYTLRTNLEECLYSKAKSKSIEEVIESTQNYSKQLNN